MTAPDVIQQLVSNFEQHRKEYQSHKNETELRREFLDPFLKALGWDVFNEKSYSERFKEVSHEVSVEVEGQAKAADYAFRVGDKPIFFVEAKKPSVNIGSNPGPAFQLRRYGWSAKLPVNILTDFEQLAVYDCRTRPNKTDKASFGRINLYHYSEYVEKWDEIAAVFSHEAVLQGAFEKFVEGKAGKKGTEQVDAAFLKEIERWRELLARNIALRNASIQNEREMNYAVQMLIDRIIFLRIGEDRGIEADMQLQQIGSGSQIYTELLALFHRADTRYNSGLFHFSVEKDQSSHPDTLTPKLKIDDRVLKDIIQNLYYPDSPYVFTYLSADILGQVYEQFLGKVIRLTAGHQAKVEEKPEVRKAGGVYYTPTYIVEYIVKNTVGKLLEGKTPKQAASLKVLDPACGSGSFLLGAYQTLLDWHVNWYTENEPEKWAKGGEPVLYQAMGGDWRLTTAEKKRILLDNIHGVDIDAQAVEVTKLSLLLKVLEGESGQMRLGFERALPDLGNNIKCGNSLIGPDYYEGQQMSMLIDQEERYRVNAFDWHKAFPQVFTAGGFDAVIGNPPYGQVFDNDLKGYFNKKYEAIEGRFDTFELFIEKGVTLCQLGKVIGYIVPSPLLSNLYSRAIRKLILEKCSVSEITNFGIDVFSDPTIHTCIIILKRGRSDNLVQIRKKITNINQLNEKFDYEISQSNLGSSSNYTFDIFIDPTKRELLDRLLKQSQPLGDIYYIRQCIKTGNDGKYVKIYDYLPEEPWKPTLRGRSISRYAVLERREYLKYGNWLARNWQNKSFYETQKIAIRETGKRIVATIDTESRFFLSSLYAIYSKNLTEEESLKFLLGILNSNLATFVIKLIALDLTEGAFTKFRTNQLARLPIRTINFSDPTEKAQHDKMVALVERMLALHKQNASTPQEQEMVERQIEATDAAIDRLVYELYGLTEAEIKIVE